MVNPGFCILRSALALSRHLQLTLEASGLNFILIKCDLNCLGFIVCFFLFYIATRKYSQDPFLEAMTLRWSWVT